MKVFVATHLRSDEEVERKKILGIFSSEQNALQVIDAIAEGVSASDYPDLFQVDSYELDDLLFETAPERELQVANDVAVAGRVGHFEIEQAFGARDVAVEPFQQHVEFVLVDEAIAVEVAELEDPARL